MKKVVIIGSPGAGKTTMSFEIAKATGLPLIHLDKYFHELDKNYYEDKEAWLKKVEELTHEPAWIMDGNYKSTFRTRIPAADTVIYLKYPKHLTVWRTLKRRVQYRNKIRPEMPDTWKEKIDPEFFRFVWGYNKKEQPVVLEMLKEYPDKQVVILSSPKETKKYLDGIKQLNKRKDVRTIQT